MKYLIFLTLLFFNINSDATDSCETLKDEKIETDVLNITTDVPKHLKGAVIIVRRSDGVETTVPAEKFKVVPRKQQFVVTKVTDTKVLTCKVKEPKEKNRISLVAGQGPKPGLDYETDGSVVTVKSRVGEVGGLQYQRLLTDKLSVGAQVQSNDSVLVNIGLDF